MNLTRQYILMLTIVFFNTIAFGQIAEESRHFNTWFSLKAKIDLSDRFYVNSQISLRRYDILKSWHKIILRARGLYKINDFLVAGLGYTYSRNFVPDQPENLISVPRSVIFSELGFTNKFDDLKLTNRFRLEHRFTGNLVVPEDINTKAFIDGTKFSNRLRYRVSFKYPLIKLDGEIKLYGAGFYELFLRMDANFKILNISGNIFKIVAGYQLNDLVTLEGGFRRTIRHNKTYVLKETNTILDMSIKYRFDFKDKFSDHVIPVFHNLFQEERNTENK